MRDTRKFEGEIRRHTKWKYCSGTRDMLCRNVSKVTCFTWRKEWKKTRSGVFCTIFEVWDILTKHSLECLPVTVESVIL